MFSHYQQIHAYRSTRMYTFFELYVIVMIGVVHMIAMGEMIEADERLLGSDILFFHPRSYQQYAQLLIATHIRAGVLQPICGRFDRDG